MATPGQLAAGYATQNATDQTTDGYLALSGSMCWDAVVMCAANSGAITEADKQLLGSITATNFSTFVRTTDPIVKSAADLRRVPQGAFMAFIENKGTPTLIHAMIATGHGLAAGNKNACIGVGSPVGWEILDLGGKLNWVPNTDSFNAVPPAQQRGNTRLVQIRYRAL